MLKHYLCLYLLLYLIQVFGQKTIIAKQGFEPIQESWEIANISTQPCTQEGDSWNYHEKLGDILPDEGAYFWGIQDLNGNCGSSGFEYLELASINIENYRNVVLSFALQVRGFDNGDDVKYQVWFNEIPQPEVLLIDGSNNLTHDDWQLVQIEIPNSISIVKLRISFKQNGADLAGLDNILLTGNPIELCSDLMISEYVEGGSSTNYRNNYIELYNPSDRIINLNEYQLFKYTGKKIEASSKMQLSGNILPKANYLIEDNTENLNIEPDLSTNNSVMNFNGDDKIALIKNEQIIDIIGAIGDSVFFAKDITLRRKSHIQNPNTEFNFEEWDIYGFEEIDNLGSHASYCQGNLPEIQVIGNGKTIRDGSKLTSLDDHSYFGNWPISKDTIIQRPFTIKNIGNETLNIEKIVLSGPDTLEFSINFETKKFIFPSDSLEIIVSYSPRFLGIHTAKLEIINTDPSENPFSFTIQGEGTGSNSKPLIISQYYEGTGNNKWIEITNISNQKTSENSYYLALYRNQATMQPLGRKPSSKKVIPVLNPGQSIKFSSTLNATAPAYAIDGTEIKTTVCSFSGDDIIVISMSDQESCWADRIDVIGKSSNWGKDISLLRKYGCDAVIANTGYEESEWLLEDIESIDHAIPSSNLRIGLHYSGLTTWKNGRWTNGEPDSQRKAIIESNYNTELHGSLETCALHVFKNVDVIISKNKYLEIDDRLTNEGNLEVQHNGSLLIKDNKAIIENKGAILVHKSTTELNPLDYTYWSSPIENAQLETVFWNSPKRSFHYFSTKNYEDLDHDGLDDDNNAWVRTLGDMKVGRGYISMAPNTTPFQNIQKVIFDGTINNGILETSVYALPDTISSQHYWNLIGNPYPSAIDAEMFLNHPNNNELLTKTLYFWTHSTPANLDNSNGGSTYTSNDYAMYTIGTGGIKATPDGKEPTQYISSCQGFFVEALKEGNIIFNNEMRTKIGNDNFYKVNQKNPLTAQKVWLNLTNKDGAFSQILIGFIDGATIEFDKNYDGIRMDSQNPLNFYSISKDQHLAIQGLPKFKGNEIIQLGLQNRIQKESILQINIDHYKGNFENYEMILHDADLNKNHDLLKGAYSFSVKGIEKFNSRFSIEFKKKIAVHDKTKQEKNQIVWHHTNDILFVSTEYKDYIQRLEVFDLNGRKLKDLEVNSQEAKLNWIGLPSRGIFILRVTLENLETMIAKIIP